MYANSMYNVRMLHFNCILDILMCIVGIFNGSLSQ
jgi:hypothetical protein